MSLRTRRGLALLIALLFVAAACQATPATPAPTGEPTAQPTGEPTGEPTAEPTGEPTAEPTGEPTPEPTPAADQELVYPTDGQMTYLNNANNDVPTAEVVQWIHEGLYTYDASLQPVPAIAEGDPEISEDGLTWTVRIKDNVVFMPGEIPLTADDVVFTYEMSMSSNCRFNPSICLGNVTLPDPDTGEATPIVASVRAVDDMTVEFVLNFQYAPFMTVILPGHAIDSRQAVEAAYADFAEAAEQVDMTAVDDLIARITAEEGAEEPDLVQFRAELEELLQGAGLELPAFATYPDEASYVAALVNQLRDFQRAQAADEANRVAAAYPLLSTSRAPVGAGPFYVTEFLPGQSLTLEANEMYHDGAPALSRVIIPIITDAVSAAAALQAGQVDWVFQIESDQYAQVRDDPNVKLAEYADFAFFGIQYNLHPEHEGLFTDLRIRQAVEHCFDKPASVEVATGGQGIPIYADIPPASWAYNPDLPTYEFDIDQANALLDEAGFTERNDQGVRVNPETGRVLQTHIPLRAGRPDRTLYVSLVVDSINTNCGFGITYQEYDFGTQLIPMLVTYPHNNPGCPADPACAIGPFEAYFGGWGSAIDPDPYALWHSSQCTTEEAPDLYNYYCFQNERADELMEAQLQELDFDARRALLWEFEEILATELPYSFAWSPIGREGLRTTVNSLDGEWTTENMDTPTWFWQLHRITNVTQ
jgi:ABC-type transport system substrate-binding protein